jgi:hypothetical protein
MHAFLVLIIVKEKLNLRRLEIFHPKLVFKGTEDNIGFARRVLSSNLDCTNSKVLARRQRPKVFYDIIDKF